jgi:hypothetical protein
MKRLGIIILAVLIPCLSYTQNGTVVTLKQTQFENNLVNAVDSIYELNRAIPFNIHIVLETLTPRNYGFDTSLIDDEFYTLDSAFTKIGVSFLLNKINTVENYNFNIFNALEEEQMLLSEHSDPNKIDIFLVEDLTNKAGESVSAYTYMPGDSINAIFVRKDDFNFYTLITQLGHFFNLYETHEVNAGGEELADGSNCAIAGDRVCDTPADPDIDGRVNSVSCNYTSAQTDTNSDFYIPETRNYMSNTPNNCKCAFTYEQYLRMVNCILKYKTELN